jgi:hypothetical protein
VRTISYKIETEKMLQDKNKEAMSHVRIGVYYLAIFSPKL